jgi:hypothetical protein
VVSVVLPVADDLAQAETTMAAGQEALPQEAAAPKIHFAEPVFDFGKIPAGAWVQHDYIFTNSGTAPLIITGVYPSCGCTIAGKCSARIEAGQIGLIPIQYNSAGFGGAVNNWLMVASNDPDQPKAVLVVKGVVWKPIDVSPAAAVFTPVAGAPASETRIIRITNNMDEPLVLSTPESADRVFAVLLKTVRPGKEFEVHGTTVPPFAHTVRGSISIKTNSSQLPVITVTTVAVVQAPK